MYYTVDENFAIRIFNDGETIPFWFQPDYPNSNSFDSKEEAESWAEMAIASYTNESAFFPPNGKNIAPQPKPTAEEIAAMKTLLNN